MERRKKKVDKFMFPPPQISTTFIIFQLFGLLNWLNFAHCIDAVIPALGRPAALGEFYDARNQTFLGITVFRDDITHAQYQGDKLIQTVDTSHTDIKYGIVTGQRSKLSTLDISASISVDIMSGLVTVSGSAAYFNEPKKSSYDVEGFLHYKSRTRRQVLNLMFEKMRPHLDLVMVQEVEATHVVIAIEYGGDVVVKFWEQTQDVRERTRIEGSLEMAFKTPKISISGTAKANVSEETTDLVKNFTLSVYGDVSMGSHLLRNSDDVEKLIAAIPQRIAEINNGFGVPMQYTLFPISTLLKLAKTEVRRQQIVNDLDESILDDFVKMFEKIERVQRDLNDLERLLKFYSNCTSGDDVSRVEMLNSNFSSAALQFKINVKNAMSVARVMPPDEIAEPDSNQNLVPTSAPSTDEEETEEEDHEPEKKRKKRQLEKTEPEKNRDALLKTVLQNYLKNDHSAPNVAKLIENGFRDALNKIELYKVFVASGVHYFGRFDSFNNLRLQVNDRIVYAIIMVKSNGTDWDQNWELFLNQLRRPFSLLAVIDCDFKDPLCSTTNKTVMRQFFRSRRISEDVFAVLNRTRDQPLLTVSALGQFGEIGDLYNAQKGQFTGKTLVNPGVKMNMTSQVYLNETTEILSGAGGLEEKFKEVQVQPPSLIYNILLQSKNVQRSGRIFREMEVYNPKLETRSLVHIFNTVEDSILDVDEGSFDFVHISRLLQEGATHFVYKILYGGQTSITLVKKVAGNKTIDHKDGALTQHLTQIGDILSEQSRLAEEESPIAQNNPMCPKNRGAREISDQVSRSDFDFESSQLQKSLEMERYTIKFASDLFENSRGEFRTSKDLFKFLNDFPRLKNKECEGRGKPLLFILYPLANLQKYFGVIPSAGNSENMSRTPKNQTTALEFATLFDALYRAQGEIKLLEETLQTNPSFVTDQVLDEFSTVQKSFQRTNRHFLDHLRHLVSDRNENQSNVDEQLAEFIHNFQTEGDFPNLFNCSESLLKFTALAPFSNTTKKIKLLLKILVDHPQIKFIGRSKSTLTSELSNYLPTDFVFVLFLHTEMALAGDQKWLDSFNLFTGILYGKPYNKLVILDCDFKDVSCKNVNTTEIHLYTNFNWRSADVLTEWDAAIKKVQEKQTVQLHRQSLGRSFRLGQLYNARKETFLGTRFPAKMSPSAVNSLITGNSNTNSVQIVKTKVISSSALDKRFEAFKIQPELQLALLFEPIFDEGGKKGSAEFLDKSLEFSSAVLLTVEKMSVSLNLESPFLPQFLTGAATAIYQDVLPHPDEHQDGPTHFVKEIRLGHNSVVMLGEMEVEADLQFLKKTFSAVEQEQEDFYRHDQVSSAPPTSNSNSNSAPPTNLQVYENFTIFTDVPINNKIGAIRGGPFKKLVQKIYKEATNPAGVQNQVEKILGQNNDDNNYPPTISFVLEPLENLQLPLGILAPNSSYEYRPISQTAHPEMITKSVVRFLQQFSRAVGNVEKFRGEISTSFTFGLTDADLKLVQKVSKNLSDSFTSFKSEFRQKLEQVKSGSASNSNLTKTLENYSAILSTDGQPAEVKKSDWRSIQTKLSFLRQFKAKLELFPAVQYIGRDGDFKQVTAKSQRGVPKFLLYFPQNWWTAQNISDSETETEKEKETETVPYPDARYLFRLESGPADENEDNSTSNIEKFFKYLTIPENDCFIMDCDFPQISPHCPNIRKPLIHQYLEGRLTSSDYLISEKNRTEEEESEQRTLLNSLREQVAHLNHSLAVEEREVNRLKGKVGAHSVRLLDHDDRFTKSEQRHDSLQIKINEVDGQCHKLEQNMIEMIENYNKLWTNMSYLANHSILLESLSMKSCAEAMRFLPPPHSKRQRIYPHGENNKKQIEVLCDFETDGGGWTIIQKRSSGPKQEFNRTWNEYVKGFGTLEGNFWLGLDNIHALTKNEDHELRIEVEDFEGETKYAKYSAFSISDASDFYKLTITRFSGDSTLQDSFAKYQNEQRFTTIDKDNDKRSSGNCAVELGGGWWFTGENKCANSNLNGLYFERGEFVPYRQGIWWDSWKGWHYSLAKSEMKIRNRKP